MLVLLFFFFSSRRRHTKWTGDWSSDVCSSDLIITGHAGRFMGNDRRLGSRLANKLNRLTQTIVIEFVVRKKVARHVCCQIGRASCRERLYLLKVVVSVIICLVAL